MNGISASTTNPQLLQAFTASPTFARTDLSLLRSLVQDATEVRLHSKQHLFHVGEAAHAFFWLQSGSLSLYRPSYNGDEKIFRTLGSGDLVAETVMFANPCHYPLSAQASEDCLLYRMSRERLLDVTRRSPELTLSLLENLASRVMQAVNRIDLLTITNSGQRLVMYLMDVYQQQGSAWLNLPASQAVLARQLNITPETLSRHLSHFKRAGLIGGRNRELVLLNIDKLCQAVNLPPPDINFHRQRSVNHLGGSLFDCCNLH